MLATVGVRRGIHVLNNAKREWLGTAVAHIVEGVADPKLRERRMTFVLGSPSFVKEMCSALKDAEVWATCRARGGGQLGRQLAADGLNWRLVDHVDTGGVTTGRFWVGKSKTTEEEEWVLELDPVRRTLLDALMDLNSGQEQEDLSLEE